jgi:hypothetical protein
MFAEEVSLVPCGALRAFRNEIPTQKNKSRIFCRSIEVQPRLLHVILRLVISSIFPLPQYVWMRVAVNTQFQ